jgi:hypothetical protein
MIGDKREWNKGYGTEVTRLLTRYAFETLNLNRVWLRVYEFNRYAIRAYEKAGYRREGVLRQDHFSDGPYWDTGGRRRDRESPRRGEEADSDLATIPPCHPCAEDHVQPAKTSDHQGLRRCLLHGADDRLDTL